MNEATEPIEAAEPNRLIRHFFYGSLMSGHYNNEALLQWDVARKIGRTTIRGFRLYDLGSYPCAERSNNLNDVLHGEVWDVGPHGARMVKMMEEGAGYEGEKVMTEFGPAIIWTRRPISSLRVVESGDWNEKISRAQSN